MILKFLVETWRVLFVAGKYGGNLNKCSKPLDVYQLVPEDSSGRICDIFGVAPGPYSVLPETVLQTCPECYANPQCRGTGKDRQGIISQLHSTIAEIGAHLQKSYSAAKRFVYPD